MPVDGIGTQRIADISPNNVQENGGGASIRSVMNAISVALAKAITPAGESVAVQNNEGNVFVFTPYYANSGVKSVHVETTTTATSMTTRMDMPQERLALYCSRNGISSVPDMHYN